MAASAARSSQKVLLNGYSSTILEEDKRRYKEKPSIISGLDPYEIPKHRNSPLWQLYSKMATTSWPCLLKRVYWDLNRDLRIYPHYTYTGQSISTYRYCFLPFVNEGILISAQNDPTESATLKSWSAKSWSPGKRCCKIPHCSVRCLLETASPTLWNMKSHLVG